MERWFGRVAVVTGASAGIGACIAVDLANAGMIVVALARRLERLEQLKTKVAKTATGTLHPFKCDVSKEEDIKSAFAWIDQNLGGADVLINNAGIGRQTSLTAKDNTDLIREVIDTNIMAVVLCTREAFQSMKARNIDDGHVVIINSLFGHKILRIPGMSTNIYPPTKYAVTAITEVLRQEFQSEGTKCKITSISPGAVRTDLFTPDVYANFVKMNIPFLESEDISEAVQYVLATPPHVQVHEIKIQPVGDKF